MKVEQEKHLINKKLARELNQRYKDDAIQDSGKRVICFDLQKVLNVPIGEHSLFYYSRKFQCLNFTITDLVSGKTYCYLWDQTNGKRGGSEIASCLYSYFRYHCTEDIELITVFCDNCPGQNKNRMICQMLSMVIQHFENIKAVQTIYLEQGHTQNENDTAHSIIEKRKRGINILHPYQWPIQIKNSSKGKKFVIEMMNYSDFMDFSTTVEDFYYYLMVTKPKQQFNINRNADISLSEIRHIYFDITEPMLIRFKNDLSNPDFTAAIIGKLSRNSRKCKVVVIPPKYYTQQIPVSRELFEDLNKLCDKLAIPREYHDFYRTLLHMD